MDSHCPLRDSPVPWTIERGKGEKPEPVVVGLDLTEEPPRELFKNSDCQATAFIKKTRVSRDEYQAAVFKFFFYISACRQARDPLI